METWKQKTLGEVTDILIGGTPARKKKEYWDQEKSQDNVWVSIRDLSSLTGSFIEDSAERITDDGVRNSNVKLIKKGTPLMSFKLSIGKTAIAGKDLYTNEAIAAFIPRTNDVDTGFLYHVLPTLAYDTDTAVKGKTLNKEKLKKAPIALPLIEEQKKISEILCSVDDDIQVIQKVIDQTERVKKGLMQDLFTKGIGHTKFKDSELGKIPESWSVTKLKDVCDIGSGGTPKKSNPEFWGGEIPWVSPKDMRKSLINDSIDKITEAGLEQIGVAKPEDLLMVVRSGILIHSLPIGIVGTQLGFNQDIKRLRVKKTVNAQFLYYYLKCMEPVILGRGVKRGNTVHSVVTSFLENLPVPIPPLKNQEDISIYRNKQQHLKVLKKGLMQDLLSGKVRV
jgi:type I restriction enzyme, S subunit